jgi:hypothetical protein
MSLKREMDYGLAWDDMQKEEMYREAERVYEEEVSLATLQLSEEYQKLKKRDDAQNLQLATYSEDLKLALKQRNMLLDPLTLTKEEYINKFLPQKLGYVPHHLKGKTITVRIHVPEYTRLATINERDFTEPDLSHGGTWYIKRDVIDDIKKTISLIRITKE